MNTKTILNIKTDKLLKVKAQETAEKMGIPLSTVMNAFLKQFVQNGEITLSTSTYIASGFLEEVASDAKDDFKKGKLIGPFETAKDMIKSLES